MCWIVAVVIIAMLALLVWASADVSSGVYVETLCRKTTSRDVVALTFDDGPASEMTPRVLDVLRRYDAQATFFVVGSKVEQAPEIVARAVAEGHTIANHTYSHSSAWTVWGAKRVEEELQRCSDAIQKAIGRKPRLFRPPMGVTNPIIGRQARRLGVIGVGWSVRSLDTITRRKREEVAEQVLKRVTSGDVILLHDRCDRADELLEMILWGLSQRGLRSVSIDDLFEIKAYEK